MFFTICLNGMYFKIIVESPLYNTPRIRVGKYPFEFCFIDPTLNNILLTVYIGIAISAILVSGTRHKDEFNTLTSA